MTADGIRQLWFEIAAPNRKVEMYVLINNCDLVGIAGYFLNFFFYISLSELL